MAQEPQRNNSILLIIAVIGVVGTVIAATITVMGNYSVEKMRQEAELTRAAGPKLITITLTNKHCAAQDYYVDGIVMVSSIGPNAKVPFNVIPGEHQVLSCSPNTNSCGDPVTVTWTTSTTTEISPGITCLQ
jgi:hypothetical protein